MTALCAHMLVDRGAPRRRCAGRALLAGVRRARQGGDHHAAICSATAPASAALAKLCQRRALRLDADDCDALAAETPWWEPGHRERLPRHDATAISSARWSAASAAETSARFLARRSRRAARRRLPHRPGRVETGRVGDMVPPTAGGSRRGWTATVAGFRIAARQGDGQSAAAARSCQPARLARGGDSRRQRPRQRALGGAGAGGAGLRRLSSAACGLLSDDRRCAIVEQQRYEQGSRAAGFTTALGPRLHAHQQTPAARAEPARLRPRRLGRLARLRRSRRRRELGLRDEQDVARHHRRHPPGSSRPWPSYDALSNPWDPWVSSVPWVPFCFPPSVASQTNLHLVEVEDAGVGGACVRRGRDSGAAPRR